jgi:hypothetical protein
MTKRNLIISITSIFGFIAICIQFYFSFNRHMDEGRSVVYAVNHFFSYFTILTNSIVAIFLASTVFFKNSKMSSWFLKPAVNGGICLYILVVGIIYYVLLNNTWKPLGGEYFASHTLHGFVPTMYAVIWYKYLRTSTLKISDSLKWLIFPSVYFVYLLIRGPIVQKYPYFFVDPTKIGYAGVTAYSIGILLFFYSLGALIVLVDRKRPIR